MRAKRAKKLAVGRCVLCGEGNPAVLDAHRALAPGGRYAWGNVMVACANCHRRMHAGEVEVLGRHPTSAGRHVWRVREQGVERFIPDEG